MITLDTNMTVVNEITQKISNCKTERNAFMRNPNAYTKMYGLDISKSSIFNATVQPKTSQITVAGIACLVAIYVGAVTIAGLAVGVWANVGMYTSN